ncbi:hypothetical protein [Neisseria yangbaofengii]|nr:hypothetical protein [Neisseria yangbaofengii]
MYPACINSLNLKDTQGRALVLDRNNNSSFKDFVTGFLAQSA